MEKHLNLVLSPQQCRSVLDAGIAPRSKISSLSHALQGCTAEGAGVV